MAQEFIFYNLQLLTDDQLIPIYNNYGDLIVDYDILESGNKPIGTELLREIIDNDYRIYVHRHWYAFYAKFTENKLRKELGYGKRIKY